MLDLTAVSGSTYEIKMADGQVLHLKRPTQALFQTVLNMSKIQNDDMDGMLNGTYDVFLRILNRNDEGVAFSLEQLKDDYDFTVALTVVGDYMNHYAKEIAERVDFHTAQ